MAQTTRTFRIFVSSTFDDMGAEREALQRYVFPRLRDLCLRHGTRFQAIDLRWGVRAEASVDQRAVPICLDEVQRCRDLSPRPNFIVLLGQRYGWRPLPPTIPADEFADVCTHLSGEERGRLETWYERDDNAVPPEHVLVSRHGRPEEDDDAWSKTERDLHDLLVRATAAMTLPDERQRVYLASATEQEIHRGALGAADAHEHVFAFFRTIEDLPAGAEADPYLDLVHPERTTPDADAATRLANLKQRLDDHLMSSNIVEYPARWTSEGPTTEHLGSLPDDLDQCLALCGQADRPETLCIDVFGRLSDIIAAEIDRMEATGQLNAEIAAHDNFGKERAGDFVGRHDALNTIANHLNTPPGRPLGVFGPSGTGKSALMAYAATEAGQAHPGAEVITRFIGATPGSSDIRTLLTGLCQELSDRYGADPADIPTDYPHLVEELPRRMGLASTDRPVILFIDAVDQLASAERARSLLWLPATLPPNVTLIVSTTPEVCLEALRRKRPEVELLELGPMTTAEAEALLDRWLTTVGRTLTDHQRRTVIERFRASGGLPLYLKLAFEEARRWRSTTTETETTLAVGVPGVIRDNLFRRLSARNHGAVLVERSLAYLAAARSGLAEDEILAVLSADDDVMDEFERGARQKLPEQRHPDATDAIEATSGSEAVQGQLPVVVWSRLYADMEPYLIERAADGANVLDFYHRQFTEVVENDYLAGEEGLKRHHALARYFGDQDIVPEGDTDPRPSLRKLAELPFQQTKAERWDDVFATLTDFTFLERKATDVGVVELIDAQGSTTRTYTGVYALLDDYALALEGMPGDDGQPAGQQRRPPLILTAVDAGEGLTIRCPACQTNRRVADDELDTEIFCPVESCHRELKINPFVTRRLPPAE